MKSTTDTPHRLQEWKSEDFLESVVTRQQIGLTFLATVLIYGREEGKIPLNIGRIRTSPMNSTDEYPEVAARMLRCGYVSGDGSCIHKRAVYSERVLIALCDPTTLPTVLLYSNNELTDKHVYCSALARNTNETHHERMEGFRDIGIKTTTHWMNTDPYFQKAFETISRAAGNIAYVEHEGLKRAIMQSMADLHLLLDGLRTQLEYHPSAFQEELSYRRGMLHPQQLPPLVSVIEEPNIRWVGSEVFPTVSDAGSRAAPLSPSSPVEIHSIPYSPTDNTRKLTIDIPVSNGVLKKRQSIPKLQRDSLEVIFQSCPYPSMKTRRQIADTLQTTPRKVQIWFQNRRAKWKGYGDKVEGKVGAVNRYRIGGWNHFRSVSMLSTYRTSTLPNRMSGLFKYHAAQTYARSLYVDDSDAISPFENADPFLHDVDDNSTILVLEDPMKSLHDAVVHAVFERCILSRAFELWVTFCTTKAPSQAPVLTLSPERKINLVGCPGVPRAISHREVDRKKLWVSLRLPNGPGTPATALERVIDTLKGVSGSTSRLVEVESLEREDRWKMEELKVGRYADILIPYCSCLGLRQVEAEGEQTFLTIYYLELNQPHTGGVHRESDHAYLSIVFQHYSQYIYRVDEGQNPPIASSLMMEEELKIETTEALASTVTLSGNTRDESTFPREKRDHRVPLPKCSWTDKRRKRRQQLIDHPELKEEIEKRRQNDKQREAKKQHDKIQRETKEVDVTTKRVFDFVMERGIEGEHVYLRKWLSQPFVPQIRADPNFYSLLNHKALKKEMTESYSVYRQVKKMIEQIKHRHEGTECPTIVLLDVCSGKGFASVLLTFKFPDLKIKMIDNDRFMNVKHLKSLPNIEMVYMDVHKEQFQDWMVETLRGKIGIMLGTHLCGQLSIDFVDAYNNHPEVAAMILAPCCLNKKLWELNEKAKELNIDNYEYWSMHLFELVQSTQKELKSDDQVLSQKNNFISAIKT
ncbi:hypothetical protein PROFUN_02181 [Planoprotostelium fungivorum]|uniref:Homeobox domain-containing protein n=1 Tax=Planoprotostelium fungivorum TaxID=1890364 RepID=A0A2P6NZC6_9EUKA|nr:hypothetical protein PROFUN_02181 [Planoprotostelium fungivorum]